MSASYKILRAIARVYSKLVYRVEYHGRKNEPQSGEYIAISNHSSFADVMFTACPLKRQIHFVAKGSLRKNPFMRLICKLAGVIPINRGASDIDAVRTCVSLVKGGECLGIYPQGTRMPGVKPTPELALAGVGLMAVRTGVPLLPVTICYDGRKPLVFRKVRVYIGKPITAEEYEKVKAEEGTHGIAKYAFTRVCDDFAAHTEHTNG